MCSAHRNAAPESPRPSGGLDTPNLYHDGEADDRPSTPQEHGSPSFDYHEERRLHLKDEIYFSHRLPRLPPPAIGGTSGGLGTSYDGHAGGLETMAQSFHSQASHMSSASPSAFHPSAPHRPMRNLSLEDEPMDGNVPEPSAGTARPTAPGAMLDPSPYTGHDTRPGLLHRVERDSQERLDLQEERREKMLAEHPDRLNNGTTGIQQRAGGKQQEQPGEF